MPHKSRGKTPLTDQEQRALRYIRNILVHFGRVPSVRDLAKEMGRTSSRTGSLIYARLIEKGHLTRRDDGSMQILTEPPAVKERVGSDQTVLVPLVGSAPCGRPLVSEENLEALIPVSTKLARPGSRYFLLRARGDSMDRAGIHDGDLTLVRQQATAESGERVVSLIDDEATIKEFRHAGDAIALVPRSSNKIHQPIILTTSFQIQGVIRGVLKNWE